MAGGLPKRRAPASFGRSANNGGLSGDGLGAAAEAPAGGPLRAGHVSPAPGEPRDRRPRQRPRPARGFARRLGGTEGGEGGGGPREPGGVGARSAQAAARCRRPLDGQPGSQRALTGRPRPPPLAPAAANQGEAPGREAAGGRVAARVAPAATGAPRLPQPGAPPAPYPRSRGASAGGARASFAPACGPRRLPREHSRPWIRPELVSWGRGAAPPRVR